MSGPRHVLTILATDDLARAVAFYRSALGWPQLVDAPAYVELGDGRTRLGLYQREGFGRNVGASPVATPAGALSSTELYFHDDDLDGAIARMRAAGARELSARALRPWGDEAAYFADPDGNVVVVARPGD
jgi:catechol 2,3-dioxygenase-like lactoylglutathione lyase family enzyme